MIYVVKWTDTSQGYHFPCEKRFATQEGAEAKLREFADRRRRFYTGVMAPCCPFRDERMSEE